ncbi:NADH-dependent [FeFe] hydrogenase, group A6 [uncultured Neglectibacter sp.]|uniref:NADH-dependent [FeFe] hydrogenase, group A6 n=1 Tax=uncultured Neglectibacter sp. TaxID=1924108 RepID=UPI0034DF52DB
MELVTVKINGVPYEVPADSTILEAARFAGIDIPTLCYLKDINQIGACRMCMVEVKGARSLVAACVYPVNDGMEVFTNTPKVQESRRMTLELLLSVHERKCLTCERSGNCELQKLCNDMGIEEDERFSGALPAGDKDMSTLYLERNNAKCILCRRCVAACQNQHVSVIGANNRGFDTQIGCAFEQPLSDVSCVACGQCIVSCPTGALTEKDSIQDVLDALNDPAKTVIVQTAPAVRAALGEEFGLPIGTNVEGKMVAALRRLGFDKVFDTDFGADMTIMEEANEFITRVKNGGKLPIITSCSPGWVKFCEHYYPDLIDNLSTCKSPQNMTGALIKTWYAQKEGIDPKDIVSVSVMPCTAKKFEIRRDDESAAGVPDVDISLTTRELARLIKRAQLNFDRLPEEKFDEAMGVSTGAAVIFGATGGVMEAALRTAADWLEGKSVDSVEYHEIRGTEGFKEAVYKVAGMDVKVAVVSGLANADALLQKVRSGEADYHFIEVMCCPGGCVNGGGQPIQSSTVRSTTDIKALRAKALYDQDKAMPLRKSHENPVVKKCYEEFLGEPGSHKAHELLHTSYVKRGV